MKLLVIGHAQHGKDTFCEFAENFGLNFISSSIACAEKVVFPALAPKYDYADAIECFEDRGNHRDEWKILIKAYNTPDLTRLATEILQENDIYCGMRDREEFEACRQAGLFDLVIWVSANARKDPEPFSSNQLCASDADIIITNNTDLAEFSGKVKRLMHLLTANSH